MDTSEGKTDPKEEAAIRAAIEKWVDEGRVAPPAGERLKRIRASLARKRSPRRPASHPWGWWLHTAAAALLIAGAGIAVWEPWAGPAVSPRASDPDVEKVAKKQSTEEDDWPSPLRDHFRLLWQELKATVLNPGPRMFAGHVSVKTAPKTAKELEPARELFEPSSTLGVNGKTYGFYAYPFTGLEKAHTVLDPTVIPAVLKGGRPAQLDPIPAMDGKKLEPENLLTFLDNARVTKIQKTETPKKTTGATMELSDGNIRFRIPIQQIELANGSNEWRLGQCELVKAIINRIAVKVQSKGEGEDSVAP